MSHSVIRKIWRDLAQRPGRSLLTCLGLSVGLWGVGSVAVAWWILGHDMQANFLSTNPPSIAISIEGDDALDLDPLAKIEGVTGVTLRPQLNARIEIAPDTWLPLVLWVVEDFSQMPVARVFPQSGSLPPPAGSFSLERDGLAFGNFLRARAARGGERSHTMTATEALAPLEDSELSIILSGGRRVEASLAGTVFDPAQAPSRMEQAFYGYITAETAQAWTGGDYNQRLLVTTDFGHHPKAIAATAERLKVRLAEMERRVVDTRFPSAVEHVHQFQLNAILFLLSGLGILALLMSVVLVVNLVNGLLSSQVRQIGVLKAIGGSTAQVASIYLGAMALLGLSAGLAAWPLAQSSGFKVAQTLSAFLNFDVLTTQLPTAFGPAFLTVGTLFPVLAALVPVRHWCGLPVTRALQYSGVTNGGRTLPQLPLPISVQMGMRNAFRKPGRTLLTAATLALGVTIFMAALNMRSSLLYTAETEESLKGFDVIVRFDAPIPAAQVDFMEQFSIVKRAETWRVRSATVLGDTAANPVPLYLVPGDSEMLHPTMLEGRWLGPDSANSVVINQRLQIGNPGLGTGATFVIRVSGRDLALRVSGVMKEFGGAAVYMNQAAYQALAPGSDTLINTGLVALNEPGEQNLATLMRRLESHFSLVGVNVRAMRSAKIASRVIRGHLDVIVAALLMVAVFMLAVSSLGMASALATTVVERTRELGVLRAIGGKPQAIRALLASEALAMALLGWITALLVAQPVSRAMSDYFGTALLEYPFDYQGSPLGVTSSLALTLVLTGIATLMPAAVANRQSIREAIDYE
jgi:ABC-type antimicrobial peptide transport system permease subunit